MRLKDLAVYRSLARSRGLYFVLRSTNPASLRYIGREGFRPKPFVCCAKTADGGPSGRGRLAGLVADPTLVPDEFSHSRRRSALSEWAAFRRRVESDSRFVVVTREGDAFHGCLLFETQKLHADYDWFDIVDPARVTANLGSIESHDGKVAVRGMHVASINRELNGLLDVPMAQDDCMSAQAKGRFEDGLLVITPDGALVPLKTAADAKHYYAKVFRGRVVLRHLGA